jgi:hypothetical protein
MRGRMPLLTELCNSFRVGFYTDVAPTGFVCSRGIATMKTVTVPSVAFTDKSAISAIVPANAAAVGAVSL